MAWHVSATAPIDDDARLSLVMPLLRADGAPANGDGLSALRALVALAPPRRSGAGPVPAARRGRGEAP